MPFLIIALSGRALASAAWHANYPVVVIDLYNDLDTRSFAVETHRAKEVDMTFDSDALLQLVWECSPNVEGLVLGSGFEAMPELLGEIAKGNMLYGNESKTVEQIKSPEIFFSLLDALDVPRPEFSFSIPDVTNGWLMKKIGGHGGTHIRSVLKDRVIHSGYYFQRIVRGRSASVLFLANGKEAKVIGFNQIFSAGKPGMHYWYGGAINSADLPSSLENEIAEKLNLIVKETGLVGLNGMDFIVDGSEYHVLEINPRPPATIDLYDPDYEMGLFHLHIEACKGGALDFDKPTSSEIRAHAVIYAPNEYRVPAQFHFPEWCSDIPEGGSHFLPKTPVCMVHAKGLNAADTERQLILRRELIENAMRKIIK